MIGPRPHCWYDARQLTENAARVPLKNQYFFNEDSTMKNMIIKTVSAFAVAGLLLTSVAASAEDAAAPAAAPTAATAPAPAKHAAKKHHNKCKKGEKWNVKAKACEAAAK